jgi:SOS-response transcriptional repressor LexA
MAKKDAIRSVIEERLTERGIDMAELSRRLGKNHAYIQQYLRRGIPATLPEAVRTRLADELDIDEALLGARPLSHRTGGIATRLSHVREIAEYNAFVSAGGGAVLSDEERTGIWPLPRSYLDEMSLSGNGLAVVPVKGDSMEPTLRSGDRVLIDMGDLNVSQGGLFVLWDGVGRVVKRVERVPGSKVPTLALISDNPLHNRYQVPADEVHIVGRVVWAARRL